MDTIELHEEDRLRIEVRGNDRPSNLYLCKTIGDALKGNGFQTIEVLNQIGEPIDGPQTLSVLDILNQSNPNLLTSTVRIYTDKPVTEVVDIREEGDTLEAFETDQDEQNELDLVLEYD